MKGMPNMGNLLRHRNQISEAVQKLEEALALYRELSDKKGEADLLANLANIEAARGSQMTALEKFVSAVKLHREIQDTRGISTGLTSQPVTPGGTRSRFSLIFLNSLTRLRSRSWPT